MQQLRQRSIGSESQFKENLTVFKCSIEMRRSRELIRHKNTRQPIRNASSQTLFPLTQRPPNSPPYIIIFRPRKQLHTFHHPPSNPLARLSNRGAALKVIGTTIVQLIYRVSGYG